MLAQLSNRVAALRERRLVEKTKKPPSKFGSVKVGVQRFGNILSGCIMPVIGVIIAWGICTAFFIPTGWTPVKALNDWVVGPAITYLIPVLIGFMGGYNVYKIRGGMIGAFATLCVVGGAKAFENKLIYDNISISLNGKDLATAGLGPQFLCAMLIGPLSAWILMKTENVWSNRIRVGFEMLVNNFYFGFLAIVVGAVSFFDLVFISIAFNYVFGVIINWLASWNGLPLTSLLVEPAKPLFLNNAINHGVFTPLGTEQAGLAGGDHKSILFLIESNPGPGMGMLLGILLFDKNKMNKGQAGGASIIHFFGGIHEVYFPFIIARPFLLLSTMAGGVFGVAMFQAFGVGARSPVSPGSVIAEYVFVNSSGLDYAGLSVGIFGAIAVSMLVTFILFKTVYRNEKKVMSMAESIAIMNARKGSESKYVHAVQEAFDWAKVNFIAFVCDAGMGSSAMGANMLRRELKKNELDKIEIKNFAITNTPENAQVIVVQKELAQRVKALKTKGYIYEIDQFLDAKGYQQLIENLKRPKAINEPVLAVAALENKGMGFAETSAEAPPTRKVTKIIPKTSSTKVIPFRTTKNIKNNGPKRVFVHEKAIFAQKELLGHIADILMEHEVADDRKALLATLKERAKAASLYMGNGLILPHPTEEGRSLIKNEVILFQWFENPIKYDGFAVSFAITLALKGNSHMDSLQAISETFGDTTELDKAVARKDKNAVRKLLNA